MRRWEQVVGQALKVAWAVVFAELFIGKAVILAYKHQFCQQGWIETREFGSSICAPKLIVLAYSWAQYGLAALLAFFLIALAVRGADKN